MILRKDSKGGTKKAALPTIAGRETDR